MKSVLEKFIYACICASVMFSLTGTRPIHAASFNVGTAVDLIDAINTANSNGQNDAIALTANITLTAANNANNGLPIIATDGGNALTINGNGFTLARSSAGGTSDFRIIEVDNGANLTLQDITISNGSISNNFGGAILNWGVLNIINSTFNGNSISCELSCLSSGGAISNRRTLSITNSTFHNNVSDGNGGAVFTYGNATITNSTFFQNSAGVDGGGIYNGDVFGTNSLTIANSTIADNAAVIRGGGIFNRSGTLTSTNNTFFYNDAMNGMNLYYYLGTVELKNTILFTPFANVFGRSNCGGPASPLPYENPATITIGADNLATDTTCESATLVTPTILKLSPTLVDNGGPTQTLALLPGSPAIDAGNAATCVAAPVSGKDQRGVTRPQGAGCDIGAYEFDPIIPVVTASNPSANAVLTSLSSITVVFNQDMLDNAALNGAENVNNYILVERGTNGSFDTTSCNGGVVSDDVQQTISTASYNSAGFITSLTLASSLASGNYRLFVCGTTSIWSVAGLELNNGASDYTVDFTIAASGTGSATTLVTTTASALPTTGFAPHIATKLPAQPIELAYTAMDDIWLEIPSQNIKTNIVGVPQNADKTWDVSWLGNNTGWLNGTAFPTWTGNSVLTAHVTNASGLDGPFAALKQLKYGDQIIIHMGGVQYIYEIHNTKLVRPYSTSFAFESMQDHSYLTLITCQGYNPLNESYLFRRVVRAVLMEVRH